MPLLLTPPRSPRAMSIPTLHSNHRNNQNRKKAKCFLAVFHIRPTHGAQLVHELLEALAAGFSHFFM